MPDSVATPSGRQSTGPTVANRSLDTEDTVARCPICGSPDIQPFRSDVEDLEYFVRPLRDLNVLRCTACGSQYLGPRPTEAELPAFYPSDYHAYNEDHGLLAKVLVAARAGLEPNTTATCWAVARGGCSTWAQGIAVISTSSAGSATLSAPAWRYSGTSPPKAEGRGYEVLEGTLESIDLRGHLGRYDIVSMNHVLEHVVDPGLALERAHQLLRPGGHLIGQLPTVTSWEARLFGRNYGGYHYPRHLQVPSRPGLAELLAAVGFADIHLRSAPHVQSALSLQNALVRRGWRPQMRYGKTPAYSALLVAVLPYEAFAWAADRGGIVDFQAAKPQAAT